MRRLVVLLLIAFVGAGLYGVSDTSSGISVNGASISASTFRSELAAIASAPTIQCYLSALAPANFAPGAGNATVSTSGAAAWSNLRVEGLAITQFVRSHFSYRPSAQALAIAKSSLEGEMTQAAGASHQQNCPGTAAQALGEMPSEMRQAQIESQAASLYLVGRLNSTIPLTTASMKAYFASHQSSYATLCVSVAVVRPNEMGAFASAQAKGATVATLAREFSVDPSKVHGGKYGCFAPSSTAYTAVRSDIGTTSLGRFTTSPRALSQNGVTFALYVALTKRLRTPFDQAARLVFSDIQNLNAGSANTVKENILYRAAVAVDPAFGRWGLGPSGPSVFAPATPAATNVDSASTLATASTSNYQ